MSVRNNIVTTFDDFTDQMREFYRCSQVSPALADALIKEHENYIRGLLVATPELIARKVYHKTTGEYL